MQIISWNIQAAKGVDDVTSVDRIADAILSFGDADIICCQEVLCTESENQADAISNRFPNHACYFGPAIDRTGTRGRLLFGNLVLSRLPVLQTVMHKLPQPAEPTARHMPRQAIEVLVDYQGECFRVVTTHLEYFAEKQRSEQVNYLATHHQESTQRYNLPSPQGGELQFESFIETHNNIYCGDFNLLVDSADYGNLTDRSQEASLADAWRLVHKDKPHAPTCGIFDHVQWKKGPHCRDFFFVAEPLQERVSQMSVDIKTSASDHQPIKLIID